MLALNAPDPQLGGYGLTLRTWNPDSPPDVEAWLRGTNDPEFTRWNTPLRMVTTTEESRSSLERRFHAWANGTGAAFCITDRDDGAILGHVSINEISWDMRRAQVGFWLLPAARGRHVAAKGLALASRWAFVDLGLHRLELHHAVDNVASCRTAERCAFGYEGTLRGRMFEAGDRERFRDAHLHARLATDPEPVLPQ